MYKVTKSNGDLKNKNKPQLFGTRREHTKTGWQSVIILWLSDGWEMYYSLWLVYGTELKKM